jgi:hypothetical protein
LRAGARRVGGAAQNRSPRIQPRCKRAAASQRQVSAA